MKKAFHSVSTKSHMHSVSTSLLLPPEKYSLTKVNYVYAIDAFIRDELSKGRYDPAISGICFEMLLELFNRTLKLELGPREGGVQKIENVC